MPKKPRLPGDKIDLAKMAGHFKNKIQQIRTGGPRPVPGQTVAGPQPKPAGSPSGKPMANDSFIRAIAAGPQPGASNLKMGGIGMKKGGSVSSASKRADGIATKGKTKGKIC